eukprot:Lankesteria_metandrocarpae@DN5471_c1_g2_i6.p1
MFWLLYRDILIPPICAWRKAGMISASPADETESLAAKWQTAVKEFTRGDRRYSLYLLTLDKPLLKTKDDSLFMESVKLEGKRLIMTVNSKSSGQQFELAFEHTNSENGVPKKAFEDLVYGPRQKLKNTLLKANIRNGEFHFTEEFSYEKEMVMEQNRLVNKAKKLIPEWKKAVETFTAAYDPNALYRVRLGQEFTRREIYIFCKSVTLEGNILKMNVKAGGTDFELTFERTDNIEGVPKEVLLNLIKENTELRAIIDFKYKEKFHFTTVFDRGEGAEFKKQWDLALEEFIKINPFYDVQVIALTESRGTLCGRLLMYWFTLSEDKQELRAPIVDGKKKHKFMLVLSRNPTGQRHKRLTVESSGGVLDAMISSRGHFYVE